MESSTSTEHDSDSEQERPGINGSLDGVASESQAGVADADACDLDACDLDASDLDSEEMGTEAPWAHIYSTESSILHPIKLLIDIVQSTFAGRELALRFFLRNTMGAYRQTLLGFIWILLPVIIQIAAWYFVYAQGLMKLDDVKHYLLFIAIGSVLWQTFFDSILAPLDAMKTNSATMTKLNFPRETLVLVGIGTVLFNLAVRAVLIGALCAVYCWFEPDAINMSAQTLLAPVYLLALIFLGTGMGLLISPIGILYEDVSRSLAIISPFWMMITPVLSVASSYNGTWNAINPPAGLLSASRDLIIYGQTDVTWLAVMWLLIAIPYFLIGLIWYRISFPIVIERMAN